MDELGPLEIKGKESMETYFLTESLANGLDQSFKPNGIPTVPEMIIEAIKDANNSGNPGLGPRGLKSYIRGRYWPGMPDRVPGPIAWRMWKRGELGKKGVSVFVADKALKHLHCRVVEREGSVITEPR
jgi:hypothetical protein